MSTSFAKAYSCDFCGNEHSPSELKRLRTERIGKDAARSAAADVCRLCCSHTVGELLELLSEKLAEKERLARGRGAS